MLIKIKKGVELAVCFWLSWRLLPPRDGTPGWCGTGPHDGMQNLQASTSRCHLVLEAEHSTPLSPIPKNNTEATKALYNRSWFVSLNWVYKKKKPWKIGHGPVCACIPRRQPAVWNLIPVPGITEGKHPVCRPFSTLPVSQRASAWGETWLPLVPADY